MWADVEGDGELVIVTFGSCTGPVREALSTVHGGGDFRFVSLRLLAPLQKEKLAAALDGARKLLVIEQNESGQLLHYLRGAMDLPVPAESLRKPGGQQFIPGEIRQHLEAWRRS